MTSDYLQLQKDYLAESIKAALLYSNPVILKTDLYNEAGNIPQKGGIIGALQGTVHGIEIDPMVVSKANMPLGIEGDIRKLPYKPNMFDVVIDLSTLDHIHPDEVERAIGGYKRVMKENGRLLLFVWTTDTESRCYGTPQPNSYQYFFNHDWIRGILEKNFKVEVDKTAFQGTPRTNSDRITKFICLYDMGIS